MSDQPLRIAYADPPYPGCAHLYKGQPDYAGEVNHNDLARQLCGYDGWILHTTSQALHLIQDFLRHQGLHPANPLTGDQGDYRTMAWVKPFAAFKRNVSVAYAWEPVLVKPCRKPVVKPGMTYRDWIAEPITLKRGLTGAKPAAVCRWAFAVCGAMPHDELDDLYPGTGAVTDAWNVVRGERLLRVRSHHPETNG